MQLDEIRKEINEIDRALKPLFARRMHCASLVAEAKREAALAAGNEPVIFVREREDEILSRLDGAESRYLQKLMEELMGISRSRQYRLLTEAGAYADSLASENAEMILSLQPGRLTAAVRILCRYEAELLSANEKEISFRAEKRSEREAVCRQLLMEDCIISNR